MTRTDARTSIRPRNRPSWCIALMGMIAALAGPLGMPAMAQQMPLTGHMLGNRPDTTQRPLQPSAAHPATTPTRTPDTHPDAPTPAVTYPATPAHAAQRAREPSAPATPAQSPMPDYTDLHEPLDTPAAPAFTTATPPPAPFGSPIGVTTAQLLRMQADNLHAGPARPMLGAEASAAYQRYLQSFHHPIPVFFKTNVEARSGGSGTGTP